MRVRPTTLEEFLWPPTMEEWDAELADDWPGPDGSSCSTDDINGIIIGITSTEFQYSYLPANFHDWLYRLGRKHRLSKKFRKAADKVYRDWCLMRVHRLVGFFGWLARQRCAIRYRGLRVLGFVAWKRKI